MLKKFKTNNIWIDDVGEMTENRIRGRWLQKDCDTAKYDKDGIGIKLFDKLKSIKYLPYFLMVSFLIVEQEISL